MKILSKIGYFLLKWFITAILRIRWAYFHVHPGYIKFYMDSNHTEAHFFHAATNSIHSDAKFKDDVDTGDKNETH